MNDDFTRRCFCPRCNVCFDAGKCPADLCPDCAKIKHDEDRAWATIQNARLKDNRFQAKGQATHELILIPGGLDGYDDCYLWPREISQLVEVDPGVVGLRCVKDGMTYQIADRGELVRV